MHRKRVTSELHDSYFRLMTIKHSISKIQWAIVLALNYYIIELSWVPEQLSVEFQRVRDQMWYGKPHPTEGVLGNPDGVWGPEKMLIRCHKESQHPAEWALGLRLNIKRTRKTQRDGHKEWRSKYEVYVRFSSTLSHANIEQPLRTLAIKWERNMLLKKSSCVLYSCVCRLSCVCYHCVGMYPVYICMQHLYGNQSRGTTTTIYISIYIYIYIFI